ncbi:hypothetical protein H5162_12755 [Pseudoalteromonas sp. SR41-8]|uniref:hypothetical protein n=1 Tax=Pseudoalteromonas sp. SR41-8 TaxID=2760946 RepID=UPI0016018265|nr:hypothetical protein [Pseudoalteromonas sp. SR41-8]MBB1310294.1 hypothetical protein [Pseudoalteromonas sp. SR41-8]
MFRKSLLIFIILISGCSDDVSQDLTKINEDLKSGKELSPRDGCIVDIVISNVVDKNNLQTYAATFDVFARAYISQDAIEINGCAGLIDLERNGIDTYGEVNKCPVFMSDLDKATLDKLNERAVKIVHAASNFENSALYQSFGRCIK